MKVLSWEQPKKVMTPKEYAENSSADSRTGTNYAQNMSDSDMKKYKAKIVKGEAPRSELRVTLEGTQVLVKCLNSRLPKEKDWHDPVWKLKNEHGRSDLKISMNGPVHLSLDEWETFKQAVDELIDSARGQA